jgi:hypothetical protein
MHYTTMVRFSKAGTYVQEAEVPGNEHCPVQNNNKNAFAGQTE